MIHELHANRFFLLNGLADVLTAGKLQYQIQFREGKKIVVIGCGVDT